MKPNFLRPTSSKKVSPAEHLKLQRTQKGNIRTVEIIPPKIGLLDFGSLIVRFKTPVLEGCPTK